MKKDKRYLVIQKERTSLKEWLCIEVTETAYKIKSIIDNDTGYTYSLISRKDEEFWILKTDISTTGEAKFKILEEFESHKYEEIV